VLDGFHLRTTTDDHEPTEELFRVGRVEGLVQLDLVFLLDLELRMGECEREIAVIGDDQQPFALHIEPADVEDARPLRRQVFIDRPATSVIIGRTNHTTRLVHHSVQRLLHTHHAISDFYEIVRSNLGGEFGDHVAVDANAALLDQLLDIPTRAKPGGG
jgi:hypothetical protein